MNSSIFASDDFTDRVCDMFHIVPIQACNRNPRAIRHVDVMLLYKELVNIAQRVSGR